MYRLTNMGLFSSLRGNDPLPLDDPEYQNPFTTHSAETMTRLMKTEYDSWAGRDYLASLDARFPTSKDLPKSHGFSGWASSIFERLGRR